MNECNQMKLKQSYQLFSELSSCPVVRNNSVAYYEFEYRQKIITIKYPFYK